MWLPPSAGFFLFHRPLGFGGLHAPSPALLLGIQIFPWVPAGKCPTGKAAEEGRAGTSRRGWKGRAALGNSLSSNGRLELLGSQQAAMAPALGDLAPALKPRYFN